MSPATAITKTRVGLEQDSGYEKTHQSLTLLFLEYETPQVLMRWLASTHNDVWGVREGGGETYGWHFHARFLSMVSLEIRQVLLSVEFFVVFSER